MIEKFKKYIHDHALIPEGTRTVLAVSGGLDSVVMAHLFAEAGYPFAIAHCNFQLRVSESDGDEAFVQSLAQKMKVDFFSEKFETESYATRNQLSIQVAARELRYHWFATFYPAFEQVAVAHHQNDALETLIYNLVKGTGLAGVRGILVKNGRIIRPLLGLERTELENYATANGIEWREDSSNASTKYARNLIRQEIIPILKKINPSMEKTSAVTFERLSAVERYIQKSVEERNGTLYTQADEGITITISELTELSEPMLFLSELLKPFHFSYFDCQQIMTTVDKTESKYFFSSEYELVKDREFLIVSKRNEVESDSRRYLIEEGTEKLETDDFTLNFHYQSSDGKVPVLDKNWAWFDRDKLVFPLTVRKWKPGDSFQPFGMNGRKKISDFLMDEKIPTLRKQNTWVICSEEEIVWVIGMRTSEVARIDTRSKEEVVIEYLMK